MSEELPFSDEVEGIAQALGEGLAVARGPVVLALSGPLGAGKTTFTKTLLHAIGGLEPAQVQSPTFLKLLEYQIVGLGLCCHMDCYRMESPDEVEKLSLETYTEAFLWIVEWPELFLEYLNKKPELIRVMGLEKILFVEIDGAHQVKARWWKLKTA